MLTVAREHALPLPHAELIIVSPTTHGERGRRRRDAAYQLNWWFRVNVSYPKGLVGPHPKQETISSPPNVGEAAD